MKDWKMLLTALLVGAIGAIFILTLFALVEMLLR